MTVNTTSPLSGPYVADGVNREWPFTFKVVEAGHINLVLTDALGVQTTVTTGYSVPAEDVGSDDGGSVTYPSDLGQVVPAGTTVFVLRAVPLSQPNRIGNQGAFLPKTHEDTFDLLAMQIQDVKGVTDRAVLAGFGVDPAALSTELLAAAAAATVAASIVSGVLVQTQAYALTASNAATTAAQSASVAVLAMNTALSASLSVGPSTPFATKALATAGLAGLAEGALADVYADESRGGLYTRYKKTAGVLVFQIVMGAAPVYVESMGSMVTGFDAAFQAACALAQTNGAVVKFARQGPYYSKDGGITLTNPNLTIDMSGVSILRDVSAPNAPVIKTRHEWSAIANVVGSAAGVTPAVVYIGYPAAALLPAADNVTPDGTTPANFTNGQQISLAGRTYTFNTVLGGANSILIGASLTASLNNAVAAINNAAGIGVTYGTGTAIHARVTANRDGLTLRYTSKAAAVVASNWTFSDTKGDMVSTYVTFPTGAHRIEISAPDMAAIAPVANDSMKLVANDPIPWSTHDERVGEMFDICLVEGSYLYTYTPIRTLAYMTDTLRIAKMTQGKLRITGGGNISDAVGYPLSRNAPLVNVQNAVEAEIEYLRCSLAAGAFIRWDSCLRRRSFKNSAKNLRTSLVEYFGAFGYVEIWQGCCDGVTDAMTGRHARHGPTSGASDIHDAELATADFTLFGGCIGEVIINSDISETENAGIDLHPDAFRSGGRNNSVTNSYKGYYAGYWNYQIRGQENFLENCHSEGAAALHILTSAGPGMHRVTGMTHRRGPNTANDATVLVEGVVGAAVVPTNHVDIHMTLDDINTRAIEVTYAELTSDKITLDLKQNGVSGASLFYGHDCVIDAEYAVCDLRRGAATGSGFRVATAASANFKCYTRNLRVKGGVSWRFGDFSNELNGEIIHMGVEYDTAPGDLANGGFSNRHATSVGWAKTKRTKNAAATMRQALNTYNTTGPKTLASSGVGDDLVEWRVNNLSGALLTMVAFPLPLHPDQRGRVYLLPTSTGSIKLPTTATNALIGADQTLAPGQSRDFFVYNNAWQMVQ